MYDLYVANKKSEKILQELMKLRSDIRPKLDRLGLTLGKRLAHIRCMAG